MLKNGLPDINRPNLVLFQNISCWIIYQGKTIFIDYNHVR